jgi:hypothetical protein
VLVLAGLIAGMSVMATHGPGRAAEAACGPADQEYRCGAILVVLEEAAGDGIEAVISRQGGDPQTDLLQHFTAVRDILAPDGDVVDTSPATVYQIQVPVGTEEQAAARYSADPAVYAAGVDRETIGTLTPDAAMPAPDATVNDIALVAAGAVLLLLGTVVAVRHERAPSS